MKRFYFLFALVALLSGCTTPADTTSTRTPSEERRVFETNELTVQPVALRRVPPVYPLSLRRANKEGEVILEFTVTAKGEVTDVQVVGSNDSQFSAAAVEAVREWNFRPGQREGHSVACRMQNFPIVFTLGRDRAVANAPAVAPAIDESGVPIYDLKQVQRPPRAQVRMPPRYPRALREARIHGEVLVDFVISIDGVVREAEGIRATREEFIAPAVEAVRRWRFLPAEVDGQPVRCHMQVPIVFTTQ